MPCKNSFGNMNFELRFPSRIHIRLYTVFIICKRHEDSTEGLQLLALSR